MIRQSDYNALKHESPSVCSVTDERRLLIQCFVAVALCKESHSITHQEAHHPQRGYSYPRYRLDKINSSAIENTLARIPEYGNDVPLSWRPKV